MNNDKQTALEALRQINPSVLDYQDWLSVGMALQHCGCSVVDWDQWSMQDAKRYKKNVCATKWSGFRMSGMKAVTVASLVKLCKDQGGHVAGSHEPKEMKELEWDATIGGGREQHEEGQIVRTEWLQDVDIEEPKHWNPKTDLINYLNVMFDSEDHVGYVTESWQNEDGKHLPKKGVWDRTAGQLIGELSKCKELGEVIGDWNKECGAWIRFNALDGKGCRDENVTSFKFALVESDSLPVGKQYAIYKELELPIAALVHSGGKSLHALCRVDAKDMQEFRSRVDYLYSVCKKNGLEIDRQNRNPSRLSRMPGITRKDKKQWLVATNIGKLSYDEWKEYIEEMNDDLPDVDNLADWYERMPELSECLIEDILRIGHKLLITGPSKAGKSFLLIMLAICLAVGKDWLGWKCKQGRVLYINLELDRASCLHRFKVVFDLMGFDKKHLANIDIWNLRGKSQALDKLCPKLIRRAMKTKPIAIIIDPIYKVITGDENKADEMSNFCNQFDKIARDVGASVIYCHHHSKGEQGQKKAQDRGSGSGVFARDPDAALDIIELELDQARKKAITDKFVREKLVEYLDKNFPSWKFDMSQDDTLLPDLIVKHMDNDDVRKASTEYREWASLITGWRIEGILREFKPLQKKNIFFSYPVHLPDTDDLLKDARSLGEIRTQTEAIEDKKRETVQDTKETIKMLMSYDEDKPITVKDFCEYTGIGDDAARNRLKAAKVCFKNGVITLKAKKKEKDEND